MINFWNYTILKEAEEIEKLEEAFGDEYSHGYGNEGLTRSIIINHINELFGRVRNMYSNNQLNPEDVKQMLSNLSDVFGRLRKLEVDNNGDEIMQIFNDPVISKKLRWIIKSMAEVPQLNNTTLGSLRSIMLKYRTSAVNGFRLGKHQDRQERQKIAQEAPQRTFQNKFQRQVPNF